MIAGLLVLHSQVLVPPCVFAGQTVTPLLQHREVSCASTHTHFSLSDLKTCFPAFPQPGTQEAKNSAE